MDIAFSNNKQAKTFNSLSSLTKKYGSERGKKLARHMKRLEQAEQLEDVRQGPGRPHELTGDRDGQISFDIGHPHRLLIRPTSDPPPTKPDGGLDWTAVQAITVVDVVDTH